MSGATIILRTPIDRARWIERLMEMPLPVEVHACPFEPKRSLHQNRWLWWTLQVVADQVMVDGRKYDAEVWHEYYKRKFLGFREVVIHGQGYVVANSTTKLTDRQMREYRYMIEADAIQELGVRFPEYDSRMAG
jgi:hypothetical protein